MNIIYTIDFIMSNIFYIMNYIIFIYPLKISLMDRTKVC
jgi:hypothetical protein